MMMPMPIPADELRLIVPLFLVHIYYDLQLRYLFQFIIITLSNLILTPAYIFIVNSNEERSNYFEEVNLVNLSIKIICVE